MRTWLALPLFLAGALALYANAFSNDFVFDDVTTLRANRAVAAADWSMLARDYRPVRYLSFTLDHALSGDAPWGYHLCNALWHGLTTFVVWRVLRRLGGPTALPLAGALLFLAHPVHTESVAYISGRRDILTTLFFLLGFLCWLAFRRTDKKRWLAPWLACYAVALGAKEMAITLPAVCFLWDALFEPARLRKWLPVYAGLALLAAGLAVRIALSGASMQPDWHGGSAVNNFLTAPRLVVHYAGLLLAPVTLVADYSYEGFPITRSAGDPRALGALLLLVAAIVLAVRLRKRAPRVSFGLGWFLVTLLPVLQIVPFHEIAAEHYLYLPSVGFCLLASLGLGRLDRRLAWGLVAVVLLAYSLRTVVRNRDWRDSGTLWRVTAEAAPRCARAQLNVGITCAREGEYGEAARRMEEAIAIRPGFVLALCQLGKVYLRQGRKEEAHAKLEEALREAYAQGRTTAVSPGDICQTLGRYDEAIRAYQVDLEKRGPRRGTLLGLLMCHERLGHPGAALAAIEQLLLLDPDDVNLLLRGAALARRTGDQKRAADLALRANRLQAERR